MENNNKTMDLMIDDWVFYDGKPIKVENVHKDCINFEPDIPYVQEEDCIYLSQIELIPLTPEILEKNGFKLNEKETASLSKYDFNVLFYDFPKVLGNRFFIEYYTEKKVAYLSDHCYISIRYVNEFQQLLRLMSSKAEQIKRILDNFTV